MTSVAKYVLRCASLPDFEAIFEMNKEAYKWYVEKIWGWDDAFQRNYLLKHLDYGKTRIVIIGGVLAGFVVADESAEGVIINSIVVAARFRSKGIGSSVINEILARARETKVPVRLGVFKENVRAQALYRRLGFKPDGETETHLKFVKRQ